jgi:hypothetical protein
LLIHELLLGHSALAENSGPELFFALVGATGTDLAAIPRQPAAASREAIAGTAWLISSA